MGLDMYLYKGKSERGYTPTQLIGMSQQASFIKEYRTYKQMIEEPSKLDLDAFSNRFEFEETEKEKKIRILEHIDQFLAYGYNRYESIKDKYDEEFLNFLEEYRYEDIGYWRKANAIHNWFVSELQDGIDDQRITEVPVDKLLELQGICEQILAINKTNKREAVLIADKKLPPVSGFFFGSTEYDESYFQDLEETVNIIKKALRGLEERDVIFYSCWW